MKKRLTQSEEFEIMKMVLDKFLWLAFAIVAVGLYKIGFEDNMAASFSWIVAGAILLVVFLILIVREYEVLG